LILSPPDPNQEIAPVKRIKINQIKATTVITPIIVERILANIDGA
jgi:hypothetical protein